MSHSSLSLVDDSETECSCFVDAISSPYCLETLRTGNYKTMSGAVDIRIIVSRSILKLCSIYDENVSTRQENFLKDANNLNFNKGDTKLV